MMKTDLVKLITLVWMSAMMYFVYDMWLDVEYMTNLVHAYIQMIVEHVRR